MRRLTSAFTLIELLVAMAVGLVLVLIALVALRATVQTVTLANRLGLENRLMREGVLEALDELDFWEQYDDPLDPAKQKLRTICTMPAAPRTADIWEAFGSTRIAPDDLVTNQPTSWSRLKLGLAFSPLSGFPVPLANDFGETTEGGQPVAMRVRQVLTGSSDFRTMLVAPAACLADDSSQASGTAYELDRDRGFDPLRPYQANDPRRWYRGNIYEAAHSDKRFGRYGMLTNLWHEPILGYGSDPREIYSFGRTTAAMPPGHQAVTGSYGPYPAGDYAGAGIPSRTWTWQSNQVVFLWEALGNYGMAEYLPSGSIISSYGARIYHPIPTDPSQDTDTKEPYLSGLNDPLGPTIRATVRNTAKPQDNYLRIDEHLDPRFTGFPSFYGYRGGDFNRSGCYSPKAGTSWDASAEATHPLLPMTDFTGGAIVGIPMASWGWDGIYADSAGNGAPNPTLPPTTVAVYHRIPWAGSASQVWVMRPLENRSQIVMPLMTQKPATWPELGMSVQRVLFNGRFTSVARVRWADPVTGDIAELAVTSIATTLRGARQQRRQGSGWATFYGVNDPRNDATLDSP